MILVRLPRMLPRDGRPLSLVVPAVATATEAATAAARPAAERYGGWKRAVKKTLSEARSDA